MLNQKLLFGLTLVALLSVILSSVSIQSVGALTPRDFRYLEDNHKTARFPGGQEVCGDHLCTSHDWSSMQQAIGGAQRNPASCFTSLRHWEACLQAQMSGVNNMVPSMGGNQMHGMHGMHGNQMPAMTGNMTGMNGMMPGNFTHPMTGNMTGMNGMIPGHFMHHMHGNMTGQMQGMSGGQMQGTTSNSTSSMPSNSTSKTNSTG